MKVLLIFGLIVACGLSSFSQNWASIGHFHRPIQIAWYDSVVDRLYVSGPLSGFDSTEVHGFGYIQGDTLIPLGCGFGYGGAVRCGEIVGLNSMVDAATGFARYHGELYVTGTFYYAGGNAVRGIAKWQGSDWVPVGAGLHGYGNGLKVVNDELYVFGVFDSINGVAANSLAKFDGAVWSPVFNLPRFGNASNYNNIQDAEWYNNELYIVGNFSQAGSNPPIRHIAKWDGINWRAVEMGIYGGLGYVKRLDTFQGKLVIAGAFNPDQNPGSIPGVNITMWDGTQWDILNGGMEGFFGQNAAVSDIMVHNDELYVVGGFEYAGGLPACNVAKWDGQRWCSYQGYMGLYPHSIAFFHDTLFIAGSFKHINGDSSLASCAKWIGGTFGDSCQLVGMDEPEGFEEPITLHPNPAQISFALTLPPAIPSCHYKIHDITGREVLPEASYHVGGQAVEIGNLVAGVYFVEVMARGRTQVIKMIKQ